MADLAVTRFYAPQHIFQIMQMIHEFDGALREAFEGGAHEKGVYFIQRDAKNRLVPCSPNKLLFSDVVSVRPGKRLLPLGFQTVYKTNGKKRLDLLDGKIQSLGANSENFILVPVSTAVELLELAYANLEFEDGKSDYPKAHIAAIEHLSQTSKNLDLKGQVFLLAVKRWQI